VNYSIAAVICAAGSSSRFFRRAHEGSAGLPHLKKEYQPLSGGLTVLGAALTAFACCERIGHIAIVVPPGDEAESFLPEKLLDRGNIFFVPGGRTRRASAYNALCFLEPHRPSHVLIHDAARPWITRDLIEKVIDAAIEFGAAIPAIPLVETPKEIENLNSETLFIKRHLRREKLFAAQTPQGFKFRELRLAHEKAREREEKEGFEYTDDAEIWGEFIGKVAVITGIPENRKITYREDLGDASSIKAVST
jgi:2-C-methyl-D-erythritol 4-phosphate cytidylyltransferase